MPQILSSTAQTLLSVTSTKLREVEKQRLAYSKHSKDLDSTSGLKPIRAALISEVDSLSYIVRSWNGPGKLDVSQVVGGKLDLHNLQFWIQQAREDPSFNLKLLKDWKTTLEMHIEQTGMKFDAAKLFGMLCDEWLKSSDSGFGKVVGGESTSSSEGGESFVKVDRKQVLDQKEHLQSMIFDSFPLGVTALHQYLEGLFSSDKATSALGQLRFELYNSHRVLKQLKMTHYGVKDTITDLLDSSALSEEQVSSLKEMLGNETMMKEIASLVNIQFSNLDSWEWSEKGLLVEMRGDMSGRFRAFTDPDLIEAILLQHLGSYWQIRFKHGLRSFFDSEAWSRDEGLGDKTRKQFKLQLADLGYSHLNPDSIHFGRRNIRSTLFVNGLQTKSGDNSQKMMADEDTSQSPAFMAKKVLNTLTTDCMVNMAVYGSHAMIHTTFNSFEHSLPHDSILIILAYLGVPQEWLVFFKSYLAMPLRFEEDDIPRIQKRGIPIGHAFSTFLSEAVRFVMDFAVNQCTDGLFLHRVRDEIWFWDSDAEKVVDAWDELKTFVKLVGLELDSSHTGSVYLGPPTAQTSLLPPGDVRWGFLKFDPSLSRFVVDQTRVDGHIRTFRQRLGATKSVLGWVNVYNQYMAYLYQNFGGTPANCFGQEHVQDLIATFRRIQQELFPNDEQGAIGQLRDRVLEEFDVRYLPDGYFYFPTSRGGLGLKNPLLGLFALQKHGKPLLALESETGYVGHPAADVPRGGYLEVKQAPMEKKFRNLAANDAEDYKYLKKKWESDRLQERGKAGILDLEGTPEFMSLEDYLSLREIALVRWGELYAEMLQRQKEVDALLHGSKSTNASFFAAQVKHWGRLDWEAQWLVSMYGEEVVTKFGSLDIVEESLIPVGVVELLKASQVKAM